MLVNREAKDTESSTKITDIIDTKYSLKDGTNIRTGPGATFDIDISGQLIKGERLYVLEEKDGWLKFRVTKESIGWAGWVREDLTSDTHPN